MTSCGGPPKGRESFNVIICSLEAGGTEDARSGVGESSGARATSLPRRHSAEKTSRGTRRGARRPGRRTGRTWPTWPSSPQVTWGTRWAARPARPRQGRGARWSGARPLRCWRSSPWPPGAQGCRGRGCNEPRVPETGARRGEGERGA